MADITRRGDHEVNVVSRDDDQNALKVNSDGSILTRLTDPHNKDTQFSAFGVIKTASENIVGDYRFIDAVRTDNEWTTTLTGTASRSFVGTGIKLNTGASGSSKAEMTTDKSHVYQSARGQMAKISVILDDAGVAGNVREWGLYDSTNGLFYRMNGTSLEIVIKRNGSETVIDSSAWDIPITPDANGHLYYVQFEWLGVGDVYFYYDEVLVHTYHFIGTSTEFSINNPDLPLKFRNENTTNTTDVSFRSGCASVITEGGNIISGQDSEGVIRQVRVDSSGRLLVSQEAATPDLATFVATEDFGNVASTSGVDTYYTISNGQTLTIQNLVAGAETNSGGSIVELFFDPDADLGVNLTRIGTSFVDGDSDSQLINQSFVGDGTARIVLRRRGYTGAAREMFAKWIGYEETT